MVFDDLWLDAAAPLPKGLSYSMESSMVVRELRGMTAPQLQNYAMTWMNTIEPLPFGSQCCYWCGGTFHPESNVRMSQEAMYRAEFDGRMWHAACEPMLVNFWNNI